MKPKTTAEAQKKKRKHDTDSCHSRFEKMNFLADKSVPAQAADADAENGSSGTEDLNEMGDLVE